ncbi:MAG TPA: hypothetical protein VG860_09610 [Terriglobia bacterium]|nr:hypothetical protein [Terriglobia bacterium]
MSIVAGKNCEVADRNSAGGEASSPVAARTTAVRIAIKAERFENRPAPRSEAKNLQILFRLDDGVIFS